MELTKQKNYQQSFDLACLSLKKMDLEERAKKAGADYQKGEDGAKIIIDFFSKPYHLFLPQIEFYSPAKKRVLWSRGSFFSITSCGRMGVH